jgi:hypothetical protein
MYGLIGPRLMPGSTNKVSGIGVSIVAIGVSVEGCVAAGVTGVEVAAGPQADTMMENRSMLIKDLGFIFFIPRSSLTLFLP